VAAVRDRPAGASEPVKVGDVITKVLVKDASGASAEWPAKDHPLDPLKLPYELRAWAQDREAVQVILSVDRQSQPLAPMPWDKSWEYDLEDALSLRSPLAVPE